MDNFVMCQKLVYTDDLKQFKKQIRVHLDQCHFRKHICEISTITLKSSTIQSFVQFSLTKISLANNTLRTLTPITW